MNVPPGIAASSDWAVVVVVVEAGGRVVVTVGWDVDEVGGTAVVVAAAVFGAAGVVGALAVIVTVVTVGLGKAVVPVVAAAPVVREFLQDGANPMDARVIPPITTPAFSKNSLRLRAFLELSFWLRICFTSISGLVSF